MTTSAVEGCVVSDSACLIGLERIGRLDILPQLYNRFFILHAVEKEIGFSQAWMTVCHVKNVDLVRSLRSQIGWGESEAIGLALELNLVLLLDDKKARRVASQLNISFTGTMGMLLKAKRQGVIQLLRPILDALTDADFRVSPALRDRTLALANEL